MKYLTQRQIDEAHHGPLNTAHAAFMVDGEKASFHNEAEQLRQGLIAAGESPLFVSAYTEWFLESCKIVLGRLTKKGPAIEYPPFVFKG